MNQLVAKLVDDRESLSEEEIRSLADHMANDPAFAEEIVELLGMDNQLSITLSVDRKDFASQIHQRIRDMHVSPKRVEDGSSREHQGAATHWWTGHLLALAATFLLIVGGVSYYLFISNIAVLTAVSGDVYVKSGSRSVTAYPGKRLYSGNQVFCLSGNSEATITCKDGSCLEVGPRTQLGFSSRHGQYQAYLSSGSVSAVINKQQARRPFMISTRSAVATVLGTELSLTAGDDSTSMEVEKGLVRIMRNEDGRNAEVPAGQSIIASKDEEFVPVNWQWSDRFKGGVGSDAESHGITRGALTHTWWSYFKDNGLD